MGCDIHCYIDIEENEKFVSNFAKIRMGRDYWLFGLMAGVRVDPKDLGATLLVEARGMPAKNSYIVDDENCLYVFEDNETEDQQGCCSRSEAEAWVKSGSSEWADPDKKRVTHPDWHTHSYLYADELKAIQEQYTKLPDVHEPHPTLAATIAAIEALNKGNPRRARLVFWFDN